MDFNQMVKNELNIDLTTKQLELFNQYYLLLNEWNEKVNLTAITDQESVYIKHFLDSLTILKVVDLSATTSICDVGAGAGFPSIPLKIVYPHLNVTIVDSLGKRITFLEALVKQLELENVELIHGRAEDVSKLKREQFDVVTARAVARLNILAELCIPLVKLNGYFIAMKATDAQIEITEAKNAFQVLGGKLTGVTSLELPNYGGTRNLINIKKIAHTIGSYPREFSKIKQKPL